MWGRYEPVTYVLDCEAEMLRLSGHNMPPVHGN